MINKFICFDLEGPLSPQDNAYELMGHFPGGDKIFEVISRYDDILTLEGREDYEPGDTLSLIVPFLICHSVSEKDITTLAERASLVNGADELIAKLSSKSWEIFCISTSYEQYASVITRRLCIVQENVTCTSFPLDNYRQMLCQEDAAILREVEENILGMHSVMDDEQIKEYLDRFFWERLPISKLGAAVKEVKPVGGRRKVNALMDFARRCEQPLGEFVVVGDSITDRNMLDAVNREGGLAVAFNANEYALPYSTMSLASTHLSDLSIVLDAWEDGGRRGAEQVVKEREKAGGSDDREHFHWLADGRDLTEVIEVHHRIRHLVRKQAAKLG